jgi:hypothetical protein
VLNKRGCQKFIDFTLRTQIEERGNEAQRVFNALRSLPASRSWQEKLLTTTFF